LVGEWSGEVGLVIKTPGKHLLAEGDDVWSVAELPGLMSPNIPGGIQSRLDFVNNEDNTISAARVSSGSKYRKALSKSNKI
jgi:hypothetical protein